MCLTKTFFIFVLFSANAHLFVIGGNFFDEINKACLFDSLTIPPKRPHFRYAGFVSSDLTEKGS